MSNQLSTTTDFFILLIFVVNIIAITYWIWHLYFRFYKINLLKRFFGSSSVIVHIPLRDSERNFPIIAAEDFEAATKIATTLRSIGGNVELRMIGVDGSISIDEDKSSVVICGPKSSKNVAELLAMDPHYGFAEDSKGFWSVLDKTSNSKLGSPLDSENPTQSDLAYIGKRRMAKKSEGNFIFIAGIHALGSLGAANFISNEKNLRDLVTRTKGRSFSGVVRFDFMKNSMKMIDHEIAMPVRQIDVKSSN